MSNFVNGFCCKWRRCHMLITPLRMLESVIPSFSPRKQNSNIRFHNLAFGRKCQDVKHSSLFQLYKMSYHNLSCWLTSFLTGKVTIRLVALCAVLKNRGIVSTFSCQELGVSPIGMSRVWPCVLYSVCAVWVVRTFWHDIDQWLSFLCFLFSWPQCRVSQEFRSLLDRFDLWQL